MTNVIATGTLAAPSDALIPVFNGTVQGQIVQLCDARTLHAFMAVLRDFSDWIKGRISKFKFVEDVDYIAISRSPEKGSGNRGAAIDYHLTLDMAKELSMVENNEKGREARKYFIACEKKALTQVSPPLLPEYISPEQCQHLTELVNLVVESGRQKTHGETWARFHSKLKVNKYSLLHPSKFEAACEYLRGKMDDTSIAAIAAKHFPQLAALPAPTMKAPNMPALTAPVAPATEQQFYLVKGNLTDGMKMVRPVSEHCMVVEPENVAAMLLRNENQIFTPAQRLQNAQFACLGMMSEVVKMQQDTEAERVKASLKTMHLTDLFGLVQQGFIELSSRIGKDSPPMLAVV